MEPGLITTCAESFWIGAILSRVKRITATMKMGSSHLRQRKQPLDYQKYNMTTMVRTGTPNGNSAQRRADVRNEGKYSILHEFLLEGLAEMLHAEHQLTKALSGMARAARSEVLRGVLL